VVTEPPSYEKLLQTLREMQSQIEERVKPMADQLRQAEVGRLRELSEQQQRALRECLAQIDSSLLSCGLHLSEYERTRSELLALNQSLAQLGAQAEGLPEGFPVENLGQIIDSRVDWLRAQGKI
jgi:hypothetical protein